MSTVSDLDHIVKSVLNFHAEDGNLLLLKKLVIGFFDKDFQPLVNAFLEAASKPLPTSICPKCKTHVSIWIAYVGLKEYKCQTCGYEWEEYTE